MSAPSPASPASSRKTAALCLASRKFTPSYVAWGGERFTKKTLRRKLVDSFFSRLGCDVRHKGDIINVFDTEHENEKAFDTMLFDKLFTCFGSSSIWDAVKEGNIIVLTPKHPHQAPVVKVGEASFEFAMGLARKSRLPARNPSIIEGQPEPDHLWAIVCRAHQERKRSPAAAVGETGAAANQTSRWEVFQVLAVVELKVTFAVGAPF